jgi:hypothetical protein
MCGTFEEACKKSGYIRVDEEWDLVLDEACSFVTNTALLRQMFAYIIIANQPSNTQELWDKYVEYFIDDYMRLHRAELNDASDSLRLRIKNRCVIKCYAFVNKTLQDADMTLPTYVECPSYGFGDGENNDVMEENLIPFPEGFLLFFFSFLSPFVFL